MKVKDILVVGVGGQGVLLLTDILIGAFVAAGFDAKKSEVHGMAQRGGSVESHVRRGEVVRSPLIRQGHADCMVAMEMVEAVRYAHWVRRGGVTIAADLQIMPSTVGAGLAEYPREPETVLRSVVRGPAVIVDPDAAVRAGNIRAVNTVLLGVLSTMIPDIDQDLWQGVIEKFVPERAIDVNHRAFAAGRRLGTSFSA